MEEIDVSLLRELMQVLDATILKLHKHTTESQMNKSETNQNGDALGGSRVEKDVGRFRKLERPMFAGEDPFRWLYHVERFFLINSIAGHEKLEAAVACLEGKALNWYYWIETRAPMSSWMEFKRELLRRFHELPLCNVLKAEVKKEFRKGKDEKLWDEAKKSEMSMDDGNAGGKEDEMKPIKPKTEEEMQKSLKDEVQEEEKELTVAVNNPGKSSHYSDAQPREEISLLLVALNKPEVFSPLCRPHPLRIEEISLMVATTSEQEEFISFIPLLKVGKSRTKGGDRRRQSFTMLDVDGKEERRKWRLDRVKLITWSRSPKLNDLLGPNRLLLYEGWITQLHTTISLIFMKKQMGLGLKVDLVLQPTTQQSNSSSPNAWAATILLRSWKVAQANSTNTKEVDNDAGTAFFSIEEALEAHCNFTLSCFNHLTNEEQLHCCMGFKYQSGKFFPLFCAYRKPRREENGFSSLFNAERTRNKKIEAAVICLAEGSTLKYKGVFALLSAHMNVTKTGAKTEDQGLIFDSAQKFRTNRKSQFPLRAEENDENGGIEVEDTAKGFMKYGVIIEEVAFEENILVQEKFDSILPEVEDFWLGTIHTTRESTAVYASHLEDKVKLQGEGNVRITFESSGKYIQRERYFLLARNLTSHFEEKIEK